MALFFSTCPGALVAVPFRGSLLYSESPEVPLTDDDLAILKSAYPDQLALVLPYLREQHCHVFVPLSGPEEGYHASFSGKLEIGTLLPFLRRRPNALTVVDGRQWGFFRIRLLHVANDLSYERVAEVEAHLFEASSDVGFELYWGFPEREPMHIRVYDRKPGKNTEALEDLMSQWARRLQLQRNIDDLFALA